MKDNKMLLARHTDLRYRTQPYYWVLKSYLLYFKSGYCSALLSLSALPTNTHIHTHTDTYIIL